MRLWAMSMICWCMLDASLGCHMVGLGPIADGVVGIYVDAVVLLSVVDKPSGLIGLRRGSRGTTFAAAARA